MDTEGKGQDPWLEVHVSLLYSLKGLIYIVSMPHHPHPQQLDVPHGPQVLALLLSGHKVHKTNSGTKLTCSLFIKHLLCARY